MVISSRLLGSIQTKIATATGLCIAGIIVVLIATNVVSGENTHRYVTNEVRAVVDNQTKVSLLNRAAAEAGNIKSELDVGLYAARNMAKAFAIIADNAGSATPAGARRAQLNAILRRVLEENPTLNGTYSAWEPDALDGNDAAFKDRHDMGSDATGRFLPYWTKDAGGTGVVQPLVDYENYEIAVSTGLMTGAWYIDPSSTGKERVIGPLTYLDQGRLVSLATVAVPVMIGGSFQGIAGANFNLDFVQDLAGRVNASILGGKGKVAIISDIGRIVADSADPKVIGRKAAEADPHWIGSSVALNGKPLVKDDPASPSIDVYSPIKLSLTETPWFIVISVPRTVAFAAVDQLSAHLDERASSTTFWQIAFGLIVALIAICLILVTARGIAKPIEKITAAMKTLAEGSLACDIPYSDRAGEIGEMARAVQVFKDNGVKLEGSEAEAARTRQVADHERRAAEVARAEVQRQQQTVVAAVAEGLDRLSKGDLTSRLSNAFAAEYEKLRADFNGTADSLRETMSTIATATSGISSGSDQIAQASDDLSRRTEQQSANLEETAAALNLITDTVKMMAANAGQAAAVAATTRREAESSGVVVEQAADAMGQIKSSSNQIGSIIGVIDDMRFKLTFSL